MKLKLTAAVLSLSAASSLAFAQAQEPQPSFRDFVDAPAGYASAGATAPAAAQAVDRSDLPQPSFLDSAPVEYDGITPLPAGSTPAAETLAAFPQPSSVAN